MSGRIVVFGSGGQVGRELVRMAASRGLPVSAYNRSQCDVTDAGALERAIDGAGVVVNCAAYTAVDRAESEPEAAFRVNARAPGLMAELSARRNIPLIHISTDYVFDGSGARPWREDDPVGPLNVYGRSKLAGEDAIRERAAEHVILRTSWIFSGHGQNFVRSMLRLAETRPRLRIVSDQRGGPTAATDIAAAILAVVDRISSGAPAWGTYHFSGAPFTTWYDFAASILADRDVAIEPIATEDYPVPAARPKNSMLDCSRIRSVFGIEQPDWRHALPAVLRELRSRGAPYEL
jgi:dTDP-4-dehydrorhamnose reductase